jgi:hypothetical protein
MISSVDGMPQGHDMSKMPGMKMSKPKPNRKAKNKKRRSTTRKRRPAKKHQMGSMPGMNMPGMNMPNNQTAPSSKTKPSAQPSPMPMNMPGMQMPAASPNPQASPPQKMDMKMPMPSPSPRASPKMEMNMPGMQMPTSSPNPQATPDHSKHMNMPMPSASPSATPMGQMRGGESPDMNMGPLMVMSNTGMGVRLGASKSNVMNVGQMGSGTSRQPGSSPMYMMDKVTGKWVLMFHYNFIALLNSQGGPRGVTKFESANWFMPVAFRRVGPGTMQLRGMFSLEPFTFAPGGSPLLFQTGETYKGQPLIDRQHPHDLFMELSAQYTVPLGEKGSWFTYFGYPGEPALGPPAFMHRASASENPAATLSHHLQDSTHISFGVFTTGFTYRGFKLEGSVFNGHEPDENRYDFEVNRWNSRSARVSFEPNNNWAIQLSYGFLRSPEAAEPDTDIRRLTASVQYNRLLKRGNWATAFIWGRNHTSSPGEVHNLNGYTFESTINFKDKNYLYTRLEWVDKNELLRPGDRALLGITDDHPSFRIGAYTFGGARDLWNTKTVSMAIGSDVSFYSKPSILDQIYGSNPVSWRLFLRVRPAKVPLGGMHSMHGGMQSQEEKKPTKP